MKMCDHVASAVVTLSGCVSLFQSSDSGYGNRNKRGRTVMRFAKIHLVDSLPTVIALVIAEFHLDAGKVHSLL